MTLLCALLHFAIISAFNTLTLLLDGDDDLVDHGDHGCENVVDSFFLGLPKFGRSFLESHLVGSSSAPCFLLSGRSAGGLCSQIEGYFFRLARTLVGAVVAACGDECALLLVGGFAARFFSHVSINWSRTTLFSFGRYLVAPRLDHATLGASFGSLEDLVEGDGKAGSIISCEQLRELGSLGLDEPGVGKFDAADVAAVQLFAECVLRLRTSGSDDGALCPGLPMPFGTREVEVEVGCATVVESSADGGTEGASCEAPWCSPPYIEKVKA